MKILRVIRIEKEIQFKKVIKFINNNVCIRGKVLVLYGLRRTGKTTIMEQVMSHYNDDLNRCAIYEIENNDTMETIYHQIENDFEKKKKTIIFLDEITKAGDFIFNSALISDVYAKKGNKYHYYWVRFFKSFILRGMLNFIVEPFG